MLHGPNYIAPTSIGVFEIKHHEVTNVATMEDHASRERVLWWIAIAGEHAGCLTTIPITITKATFTFPSKVWWVVIRAQLRPTTNDNTLYPSLASLVACLLRSYLVNTGRIIATEMLDRSLNERVKFPFPCLIGKLCFQEGIPPNCLVNRCCEASRMIQVSKTKDSANHLFGSEYAEIGNLNVAPPIPL